MSFIRILKNVEAPVKTHKEKLMNVLYGHEMYNWLLERYKFRIVIRQCSNEYSLYGASWSGSQYVSNNNHKLAKYHVYVIMEKPQDAVFFKLTWADSLKELNDEFK